MVQRFSESVSQGTNESTVQHYRESMRQWINELVNQRMNEWMNEWRNEGMNEWINERTNEWTNEPMKEWRNEGMKEWRDEGMKGWRNEGMKEWRKEWRNEGMKEWRNEGMKEWRKEGVKEGMNEWMDERMNEWTNERMNEWRNEGMKEWRNQWMNQWINQWINEICQLYLPKLPWALGFLRFLSTSSSRILLFFSEIELSLKPFVSLCRQLLQIEARNGGNRDPPLATMEATLPKKPQGFAPESLFKPEFTPFRTVTLPDMVTWWYGWHDDTFDYTYVAEGITDNVDYTGVSENGTDQDYKIFWKHLGNPILTTSQTSLTKHRWHVKYSSIIHLHLSVFPSAPCLTAPGDAFTARWKCSTPGTLRHGWCKNRGVQATPSKMVCIVWNLQSKMWLPYTFGNFGTIWSALANDSSKQPPKWRWDFNLPLI